MNVLSITHCTASKGYISEIKVSDLEPNQNIKEISYTWSDFLNKPNSVYIARNLYKGGGFKKICKSLPQTEFFIISAGLGLISSDKKIPSYECTVSRGKSNSISDINLYVPLCVIL